MCNDRLLLLANAMLCFVSQLAFPERQIWIQILITVDGVENVSPTGSAFQLASMDRLFEPLVVYRLDHAMTESLAVISQSVGCYHMDAAAGQRDCWTTTTNRGVRLAWYAVRPGAWHGRCGLAR